ncbi:MAG: dihydropteroate synthase [Nevskiales bacterium]|nr:dihydropteroate synthase [Nevskiales bacterium]
MGVLNVTPDSFSDGGLHATVEAALAHARKMLAEGAQIIDVGGESTRPGATPVLEQEELDRTLPVIEIIHRELDVAISIDTMKPAVMRAACAAGAEIINDTMGLRASDALATAHATGAAVCLMHMQGEPRTMQRNPQYENVVTDVKNFLAARVAACIAAGLDRQRLIVDPGFGFGKTLQHNLQLLAQLHVLSALNLPVLVGLSRKSMLGQVLDRPIDQRLHGALAAAALAVWQGVHIIRTHDVRATMDAVRLASATREAMTGS